MTWKDFDIIIDRLYTHFLLRDLAYLVSGLIVISAFVWVFNLYETIIDQPLWIKGIVLLFSYYLGLICQEGGVLISLYRMYPSESLFVKNEEFIKKEANHINCTIDIIEKEKIKNQSSFRKIERIVLIKNISASIGCASLLSFIFLLVHIWYYNNTYTNNKDAYITLMIFLVLITAITIKANRRKAGVQEKITKKQMGLRQQSGQTF